jgi:hypothetical protein
MTEITELYDILKNVYFNFENYSHSGKETLSNILTNRRGARSCLIPYKYEELIKSNAGIIITELVIHSSKTPLYHLYPF